MTKQLFFFRFAHTTVESYLKNPSPNSREVTFSMILPDTAFVSNFSMILKDGEEFVAKVEEKTKAKQIYDAALKQDSAAGIVHRDTRNANQVIFQFYTLSMVDHSSGTELPKR